MQPLISISKASTPVRTRIIGGSQINSTPVNIHKVAAHTHKSPNNKENYVHNHLKTEGYPIRHAAPRTQTQTHASTSAPSSPSTANSTRDRSSRRSPSRPRGPRLFRTMRTTRPDQLIGITRL